MNFVIVFLTVVCVTLLRNASAVQNPPVVHSSGFEDIHAGKRLVESLISDLTLSSKSKCAIACNKNESCRSFNFCQDGKCELNREDVYSTVQGEKILQSDPNCKYYGMKRSSVPVCQEDGEFADIQNDGFIGQCKINGKRVDRGFGSWPPREYLIDKPSELHTQRYRAVAFEPAHGGNLVIPKKEVFWLKFVTEKVTWSNAKAYCETIGGKLFYNVDGTEEQIDWLLGRMDNEMFWIGVSRDAAGQWVNVDGAVMDDALLHWGLTEPNGGASEPFLVGWVLNSDIGLFDFPADHSATSICDMLL